MLVPIPKRRPVSFPIASWSPVQSQTFMALDVKPSTNQNRNSITDTFFAN